MEADDAEPPIPFEGAPAVVIRYLDPAPSQNSHDLSEEHDIEVGFLDGEQSFSSSQKRVPA